MLPGGSTPSTRLRTLRKSGPRLRTPNIRSKRPMVAVTVERLGADDPRVIDVLLASVRCDHPSDRAAQALVRIGVHIDEAILPLASVANLGKMHGAISMRPTDDIGASETLAACSVAASALVEAALLPNETWIPRTAGTAIARLSTEQVSVAVDLLRARASRAVRESDEAVLARIAGVVAAMGPGGRPVATDLIPLLHSDDDELREAAALAVIQTGEESAPAVTGLAECLGSPGLRATLLGAVSSAQMRAFVYREPKPVLAKELLAPVQAAVMDPDPRIRASALLTLTYFGAEAAAAHNEIALGLLDEDEECRRSAACAVIEVGSAVLPPQLAAALEQGPIDPERYFDLCWTPGIGMPAAARAAFAREVRTGEDATRFGREGVYFSESIAEAEDTAAALRILTPALRRPAWCGVALYAIKEMGPRAAPAVPAVAEALDCEGAIAARTLAKMGPAAKAAVPALVRVVKADDVRTWSALDTLKSLGPAASEATPAIVEVWLHRRPDEYDKVGYAWLADTLVAVEPDAHSLRMHIPALRDALLTPPPVTAPTPPTARSR